MSDPFKPFNPADDEFLRSLGGLLDEPLEPGPAAPEAVEAAGVSESEEDPFALPAVPISPTPAPALPIQMAAAAGEAAPRLIEPTAHLAPQPAEDSATYRQLDGDLSAGGYRQAQNVDRARLDLPLIRDEAAIEHAGASVDPDLSSPPTATPPADPGEMADASAAEEPALVAQSDEISDAFDLGAVPVPGRAEPAPASPSQVTDEGAPATSEPASKPAPAQDLLSEQEQIELEAYLARTPPVASLGSDAAATDADADEDPFALPTVPGAAAVGTSPTDDLIAAVAGLAPDAPAEPPTPRESLAQRMSADLSMGEPEPEMDLSLPSFEHETPAQSDPDAGPFIVRRRVVEQAKSTAPAEARFPLLAGLRAAAHEMWDGPLGWRAHPDRPGYVATKAFLRLGLGFTLPLLVAFFIFGLPFLGSAYPAQALDASQSNLRWAHPLTELPAPLTYVDLEEGGRLPSTTIPILINLYGNFFTTYDDAVVSGSTIALDALLTPGLAASVDAEIADLRAHGDSRQMYGYGPFADALVLRSGSPGSDPTDVLGSVGSLTNVIVTDASGNEVSNLFYDSFDAHFARLNDGTWRLSNMVFNLAPPLPSEGPLPSSVAP